MSNYVWNKVFCTKEMMEKYFIDPYPFGKKKHLKILIFRSINFII